MHGVTRNAIDGRQYRVFVVRQPGKGALPRQVVAADLTMAPKRIGIKPQCRRYVASRIGNGDATSTGTQKTTSAGTWTAVTPIAGKPPMYSVRYGQRPGGTPKCVGPIARRAGSSSTRKFYTSAGSTAPEGFNCPPFYLRQPRRSPPIQPHIHGQLFS